jgi:cell division protease FtsH
MQMLILTMIFGSLGRKMYVNHHQTSNTGPPVELAYSSFLDLVGQSGAKGSTLVVVDNVRISPERIVYRITKEATPDSDAKSVIAYTNKVAASPELIQHLRSNDILFTAAPQKRANTLAVVARTAIMAFYMLILFRMYKTFSGNSGSGDIPGKLASTANSLSLASFNDIQGIDDAKVEVMELVDTLINPSKYEILGARAPTGLLLEGPPGTGKVNKCVQGLSSQICVF